jgi:hypothetical protein
MTATSLAGIGDTMRYWLRLSRPAWVGGGIALSATAAAANVLARNADSLSGVVYTARMSGLVIAVVVAAPLLDLGRATLDATPYPRMARRLGPVAISVIAIAAVWACLVAILAARSPGFPTIALSLEVAATALFAAAVGAWCPTAVDPAPAAAAVVALVIVADENWVHVLTAYPGGHWARAHAAWAVVLAAATTLLLTGLRDPAARIRRSCIWRPGRATTPKG